MEPTKNITPNSSSEDSSNPNPIEESPSVIKTTGLAKRIFTSPLFWNVLMATAAATFAVVVTFSPIIIPTLAVISVVSLLALGIIANTACNKKRLVYEVSLLYSRLQNKFNPNWSWYNEIVRKENGKGSITLGAIPLKSLNHHIELKDYAFLAMVEEEEMRWPICDPLTPEDREQLSPGNHKHISTPDFKAVACKDLHEGVEWVKKQRNQGKDVYIHCKAGRSRSASVLLCYLLHEGIVDVTGDKEQDIKNAFNYIKERRSQASVGPEKREEIGNFYDQYIIN